MLQDSRFLKGIEEFNQGLFYECHETLEEVWLEEHGPERELYQGIIQVAAAYFKWEQDVPAGAVKLLRSGLLKLAPYAPRCLDLDIATFIVDVESDLRILEASPDADRASRELSMPRLDFLDRSPEP